MSHSGGVTGSQIDRQTQPTQQQRLPGSGKDGAVSRTGVSGESCSLREREREEEQIWLKTYLLRIGMARTMPVWSLLSFIFFFFNFSRWSLLAARRTRGVDSNITMCAVPGKLNWDQQQERKDWRSFYVCPSTSLYIFMRTFYISISSHENVPWAVPLRHTFEFLIIRKSSATPCS